MWGDIDLKSIAREVEADVPQPPINVQAEVQSTKPMHDKTETDDLGVVPQIADTTDNVADERELSVIDAVEPDRAPIAADMVQKPEIAEEIVSGKKGRSVRRSVRKAAQQKGKTTIPPIVAIDSRSELLSLESENASLKRELLARLSVENEALLVMLKQVEQRTTHSR